MTTSNSVTLKTINGQSSKCEAQATKLETKIKTINKRQIEQSAKHERPNQQTKPETIKNRPIKQVRSTSALSDQQDPKRTPSFQYHYPNPHHYTQFSTTAITPTPNLRSEATKSPFKGI